MKQVFKWIIASLILVFLATPVAWAKTEKAVRPELILMNIQQLSAQESNDEVYLLVSDLNSEKPDFYTIPGKQSYFSHAKAPLPAATGTLRPHHYWRSQSLGAVKNVSVWSRELKKGMGAEIVISLVEADMPPWDLDDMLGNIKFNIKNSDGRVDIQILGDDHAKIVKQEKVEFGESFKVDIESGKAKYLLRFKLIDKSAVSKELVTIYN